MAEFPEVLWKKPRCWGKASGRFVVFHSSKYQQVLSANSPQCQLNTAGFPNSSLQQWDNGLHFHSVCLCQCCILVHPFGFGFQTRIQGVKLTHDHSLSTEPVRGLQNLLKSSSSASLTSEVSHCATGEQASTPGHHPGHLLTSERRRE